MNIKEIFLGKIEKKVEKTNSCWIWNGYRQSFGYGQIRINKKLYLAHRLSYELFVGLIPKGLFICHKCDIPFCINPEHLFLGTQKDNIEDCKAKGRMRGWFMKVSIPKHGTHARYRSIQAPCRCDKCRRAATNWARLYRLKKKYVL